MAIGSECLRDKRAEAHMFISETQTPVEVKRFLFLWCLIEIAHKRLHQNANIQVV